MIYYIISAVLLFLLGVIVTSLEELGDGKVRLKAFASDKDTLHLEEFVLSKNKKLYRYPNYEPNPFNNFYKWMRMAAIFVGLTLMHTLIYSEKLSTSGTRLLLLIVLALIFVVGYSCRHFIFREKPSSIKSFWLFLFFKPFLYLSKLLSFNFASSATVTTRGAYEAEYDVYLRSIKSRGIKQLVYYFSWIVLVIFLPLIISNLLSDLIGLENSFYSIFLFSLYIVIILLAAFKYEKWHDYFIK